jgi:hypothetical protein
MIFFFSIVFLCLWNKIYTKNYDKPKLFVKFRTFFSGHCNGHYNNNFLLHQKYNHRQKYNDNYNIGQYVTNDPKEYIKKTEMENDYKSKVFFIKLLWSYNDLINDVLFLPKEIEAIKKNNKNFFDLIPLNKNTIKDRLTFSEFLETNPYPMDKPIIFYEVGLSTGKEAVIMISKDTNFISQVGLGLLYNFQYQIQYIFIFCFFVNNFINETIPLNLNVPYLRFRKQCCMK